MAIVEWPRRSWTTRGWTPRSRARVAQVWRRPWRVRRGRPVTADPAEEGRAHRVGPQPAAVGLVEDEAEVVEVGADEQPLFEHAAAVVPQGGDGALVERH